MPASVTASVISLSCDASFHGPTAPRSEASWNRDRSASRSRGRTGWRGAVRRRAAWAASGHRPSRNAMHDQPVGHDRPVGALAIAAACFNVNCLNMSWKRRAREGAYHHGNLREALIQAARELIREKGPAGFTFADAARSAGVSPAAPYRHFRDREALLADVAREGFGASRRCSRPAGATASPMPSPPSTMSAAPTSLSPAPSPPTTPRCSNRACRPTSTPICASPATRAFGVLRTAADALVGCCPPASGRPP